MANEAAADIEGEFEAAEDEGDYEGDVVVESRLVEFFNGQENYLPDAEELAKALKDMVSTELAELRVAHAEGRRPDEQELPDWAEGFTVLQLSCLVGNIDHVTKLLEARADANQHHTRNGNTALHNLVTTPLVGDDEKAELIEQLMKAKADPNRRNIDDKTPAEMTDKTWLRVGLGSQSLELIKAAARRDATSLQEQLEKISADGTGRMSVDILDLDGWTALHIAAYRPASECATLLIQARASVNALTKDTWQAPLHLAARSGSFDIAKQLIDALADVHSFEADQDNDWEYTSKSYTRDPDQHKQPLHLASEVANVVLMKMLLDAAADVNAKDSYKCTPLHLAVDNIRSDDDELPPSAGVLIINGAGVANGQVGAINGCREVCEDSACVDPECAQHAQDRQFPVLVEGSLQQLTLKDTNIAPVRLAALDLLLEARADVNLGNRKIGMDQSLLHEAVCSKDLVLAKKAIQHGAVVNMQRTSSGFTPLHMAVRQRHADMISLLRGAGADLTLADVTGKTAIDLAAANRLPAAAAAALLDESTVQADPGACLVVACCLGDAKLAKLAIEAKASVKQLTEQRLTALDRAMQSNKNEELVKLLIDAQANLPLSRASRKRPLQELYLN